MDIDLNQFAAFSNQKANLLAPQPGQIWELRRTPTNPLSKFNRKEQQKQYPNMTRKFLQGNSSPRYVMIVKEPELSDQTEVGWQIVSIMLLSKEVQFLSDVDLLVPSHVSGLQQDMLAETWHVLPMLVHNLLRPVGQRLSRRIYDLLLTVGDYYHGLVDEPLSTLMIQQVGLIVGSSSAEEPQIQAFHEREEDWSDVLRIPLYDHPTYSRAIKLTERILDEALRVQKEVAETAASKLDQNASDQSRVEDPKSSRKLPVFLGQWIQNIFGEDWQAATDVYRRIQSTNLASARSSDHFEEEPSSQPNHNEVLTLIAQLSPVQDEQQQQRAARRLAQVAPGNAKAVQALVNLVRTTQDDETLWIAVESLWQIDPGNSEVSIRRMRLVDLGMQVAGQTVALAVALVQKANQQVGVLLQVYPTGNEPFLPSTLKLTLLNDLGQSLREVTARDQDIYIQLKLSGKPGEQFSVVVALGESKVVEDFIL
jgi:hypothetical protein